MFIVNNIQYSIENSKLYDTKTRNYKNLFQPQPNLSSKRGCLYGGIKMYINLPIQIKLLSSNFNQFKKALKDIIQLHSSYAVAEYLNYNKA